MTHNGTQWYEYICDECGIETMGDQTAKGLKCRACGGIVQ